MSRTITLWLCSCLVILSLALNGCGIEQTYNKKYYVLDVNREQTNSTQAQGEKSLQVWRFTIDSSFGSRGLIYRTDEFSYEQDFYNEFIVSPASMITDKIRTWLSLSPCCQDVLNPGTIIDPSYILEGNVTALYGDYRDKTAPVAVMEIRISLLQAKQDTDPAIIFSKTYRSSIALQNSGPEGLVAALDKCLVEILTNLEKDLADKL